ncbi:MAG: hypothetical protein GWO20_10880 [Candidatus Korarchaeota archaeon]|nr:hypothetical protein [Candidatus Korarchaeota archaeon]NIU83977.1 hypothetical protein [Candidatus Thorarchaeota archaeon]NIW14101.1 hypothetical protein [Candidatus Thorarchaeota archaeon]NIW52211.1 hypothetical protein [Candidatus Korarchaeota archaeon]
MIDSFSETIRFLFSSFELLLATIIFLVGLAIYLIAKILEFLEKTKEESLEGELYEYLQGKGRSDRLVTGAEGR